MFFVPSASVPLSNQKCILFDKNSNLKHKKYAHKAFCASHDHRRYHQKTNPVSFIFVQECKHLSRDRSQFHCDNNICENKTLLDMEVKYSHLPKRTNGWLDICTTTGKLLSQNVPFQSNLKKSLP